MTTGSGGGLLTIVLSLLTSHMISLDITAHSDALRLAGNLVAGLFLITSQYFTI